MIVKLNKINNIGSFQYFDWDTVNPPHVNNRQGRLVANDTSFKKYNILYGENGTGKSTIVRIFKSIDQNTSLLPKHWDRESEDRFIEIIDDSLSQNVTFTETNHWVNNSLKGKFLFFDRDFINEYVHSFPAGRNATHDKNTGKLVLLLGDFNTYKKQLDNLVKLEDELETENKKLEENLDIRKNQLGLDYPDDELGETFNRLKNTSPEERKKYQDVVEDLEKVKLEKKEVEEIISRSAEIEKIPALTNAGIYSELNTSELEEAFKFSVASGTIEVLKKIKDKESFIQAGVREMHQKSLDTCPFCEQDIKKDGEYIHIVEEYEKIFNEEFTQSQKRIENRLRNFKEYLLDLIKVKGKPENTEIVQIINKLFDRSYSLGRLELESEDEKFIRELISVVDEKLQNILTPKEHDVFSRLTTLVKEVNKSIHTYNKKVDELNDTVSATKKDLQTGVLAEKKKKLEAKMSALNLEAAVINHFGDLESYYTELELHKQNVLKIQKVKTLISKFRDKVREKFKTFTDTYFSEIEKYVTIFCPSIEINVVSQRVDYDFRSDEVVCGLEVHYKDRDRFSELSEGERQSVALAYFLALLSKTTDKHEKIVVFDDPINSFDAGRRKMCAEYIYKEVISFQQCFVLTCDLLFKTYLLKVVSRRSSSDRFFGYILKSASSAIHHRRNDQTTIYSTFKGEFRNIVNVHGTDENIIVYGQKLRYCIEEVKDKYLGYSEDSLGEVLTKVQNSDFEKFKNSIDEIRNIYSYCNTGGLAHYPRDGQTSWDELKHQIQKYLSLGV